jgi:hypothetical protein
LRRIAFALAFCVEAWIADSTPWTHIEFKQLELGDARLNKRARLLMETMATTPMPSVPKACHGWGETMAAYRFFDNDKLEWHAIWEPRWQQTQERMAEMAPVLPCTRQGGVPGRKGDGEPGAKTIWLGLREVHAAAKTLPL